MDFENIEGSRKESLIYRASSHINTKNIENKNIFRILNSLLENSDLWKI